MRIERIGLEHHGKPPLGRCSTGHVAAVDLDRAGRRVFKAGDQPQKRRLSTARGTDEDDELALVDRQVDARNDLRRAKGSC
jgi:hypothetical protein